MDQGKLKRSRLFKPNIPIEQKRSFILAVRFGELQSLVDWIELSDGRIIQISKATDAEIEDLFEGISNALLGGNAKGHAKMKPLTPNRVSPEQNVIPY